MNRLQYEKSPYLLQHRENPVEWYAWGKEAFAKAKREDKPVFLSIGYSTCHWCHVMAHESFEDTEIADLLNRYFVSIKVDKEERPDIDSIYMEVCQAMTGSGGWPTTIFMTPEQKPFFAGTYFPKTGRYGHMGLKELLLAVHEKWDKDRAALENSAEDIVNHLNRQYDTETGQEKERPGRGEGLIVSAVEQYKRTFDERFGGFGNAPKFPTPHNLLFLMNYYEKSKEDTALKMVEKTLLQMYRGGMFDHIGGGFCRYSTDRFFLAPHFEKMLYDNALLILAYCRAYQITGKFLYLKIAQKTGDYVLREMTAPEGGFYSAQDADSEGEEGKYYLFRPEEIKGILGEEIGGEFNRYFDITDQGNFEGKNIPNHLHHEITEENFSAFDGYLPQVYNYRRERYGLHLDDKILTAWNGFMIGAMCCLYRVSKKEKYLQAAKAAREFIQNKLWEKDILYVSYRDGKRSTRAFLDDYAAVIFALLELYEALLDNSYLARARQICKRAISDFYDEEKGGFFLYGEENEQLILKPKESYDGAIPSGNSLMAYNLVKLSLITGEEIFERMARRQLDFMAAEAAGYPAGYSMFLNALLEDQEAPEKITIVVKEIQDLEGLSTRIPLGTTLRILGGPTREYPLKNDKTTFYVCRNHSCQPPVNQLEA